MRQDLAERLRMVYTRDDGQELGGARRSMTWRQFILAVGLHTAEEIVEDRFGTYWHTEGRKSSARLSRGHVIGCLAHHFGLVSNDGLRGLSVVTTEILFIDIGKLVKINIYREIGDDWAWHLSCHATGMTVPQRLEGLEEEMQGLGQDVRSVHRLMERLMTDQGRFFT
nr:hypothetical protein [Tanacetum cinerariifolium]